MNGPALGFGVFGAQLSQHRVGLGGLALPGQQNHQAGSKPQSQLERGGFGQVGEGRGGRLVSSGPGSQVFAAHCGVAEVDVKGSLHQRYFDSTRFGRTALQQRQAARIKRFGTGTLALPVEQPGGLAKLLRGGQPLLRAFVVLRQDFRLVDRIGDLAFVEEGSDLVAQFAPPPGAVGQVASQASVQLAALLKGQAGIEHVMHQRLGEGVTRVHACFGQLHHARLGQSAQMRTERDRVDAFRQKRFHLAAAELGADDRGDARHLALAFGQAFHAAQHQGLQNIRGL